jgi:glyoxylase-like metal-dependent hydrolase (beta-lactamase superfamily II)
MSMSTARDPFEVADDVYCIDTGLFDAGSLAVYLFDGEEPVLVDAGTAASAETVTEGMADCGVEPPDLEHLVVSHIHVDHSGGASALVEENPDLDVYIHEMTAPHLADPAPLIESSREAMGEHFDRMGEQGPVPEDNIVGVPDEGVTVEAGGGRLELVHAPGHSPDHLAVWNPDRQLLFAAECLGMCLERADRWVPPGTLPNFDIEAIERAIDRLAGYEPDTVVFPHFGAWPRDSDELFETAERELHRWDDRVLELYEETGSVGATVERAGEELLDIAPPYAPVMEAFYARLVTLGFLNYHGIEYGTE